MTELDRMTAHLMEFVKVGSRQYAVQAALDYEKLDPFTCTGLPASLDVAIALHIKEKRKQHAPAPDRPD